MSRITVIGLNAALAAVRERYPSAWVEGSTGFSKSYWIKPDPKKNMIMVATVKPKKFRGNPETEVPFWLTFVDPEPYPSVKSKINLPEDEVDGNDNVPLINIG